MSKLGPWGRWHRSGGAASDSKFEEELHKGVLKDWVFHPELKIKYMVEHNYSVDFTKKIDDVLYLIEAKGRFQTRSEATKYIHIRKYLNDDQELVFLFQKPNTPMPNAKKRKDGTKQTMAEWAEKYKFRWYTKDTIGELDEDIS